MLKSHASCRTDPGKHFAVSGEFAFPSSSRGRDRSTKAGDTELGPCTVTFIPMPVPEKVCRTVSLNEWMQYDILYFLGGGMDTNITAQTFSAAAPVSLETPRGGIRARSRPASRGPGG